MAAYRVIVYEIEHPGDLEQAESALRRAGAQQIEVLGTDYEGAEAAGFRIGLAKGETLDDFKTRAEGEGVCF